MKCEGVKWTGGKTSKNSKILCSRGGRNFVCYRARPLSHTDYLPETVPLLVLQQRRSRRARWWAHTLVSLLHYPQQCSARPLWYTCAYAYIFTFSFGENWEESFIMEGWLMYLCRCGHWSRMASFRRLGEHRMLLPIRSSTGSRTGLQGRLGRQGKLHLPTCQTRSRKCFSHQLLHLKSWMIDRGSGWGCWQEQLCRRVYCSGWFIEPTGIKR